MEINTEFGKQEIDPESVITLPRGMAGFEDLTDYKLFHEEGKPTVFWLQSTADPGVRFPVTDPALLNVAYEVMLSDDEEALLQVSDPQDLAILVTLAKGEGETEGKGIHTNLLGPIFINMRTRIGLQKLLNDVESAVVIRAR